MAVAGGPAAFMSYARFEDAHDNGQLSMFRERLAAEIQIQTGLEFPIFQDRNDIAWGQNWQQRVEDALDVTTLLLVIITPGLFQSPACRAEADQTLLPLQARLNPLARSRKMGICDAQSFTIPTALNTVFCALGELLWQPRMCQGGQQIPNSRARARSAGSNFANLLHFNSAG
jgi:hypothetical protein